VSQDGGRNREDGAVHECREEIEIAGTPQPGVKFQKKFNWGRKVAPTDSGTYIR
jgi:hypothetical protein